MDNTKYKKVLYVKYNNPNVISNIDLDITDGYELNIKITSNSEYVGFLYNSNSINYLIGAQNLNNGLGFWIGNNTYYVTSFRKGIVKVDSIKDGNIYINGKLITSIPFTKSFTGGINGYGRDVPEIYDIKIIKESGDLKYHFIPVVNIETNIAGLYDDVNNRFYGDTSATYRAFFDFSKVTALQIPEGNVTKIATKDGKVLWDNLNKYAYGVRWNSVNQATTACERIGNLQLHKTLPIQSRFKVCIHKGKEIQYYCHPNDSRFVEDSKKAEFTYQKADMNLTACDGLPTGVVSCEENSVVKCKFINENLFSNYRFLYSYVYIQDNVSNAIAIGRIVYIDTSTHEAYIDDSENIQLSDYVSNESVDRYPVSDAIDRPWFSNDYRVELGCSINGYDGEIGVDTGGKFYQWSVDKDGNGNEVWQSLYKCVPYAREIKRHIIGIDRACVLNTAFNDAKWGWIGTLTAWTAVNVINYDHCLKLGTHASDYDNYLGVDNFRCQLCKAATQVELSSVRHFSQKTDGGQMLYKQIWEAIVWSYVIEYADFDVNKTYNSELTTEGYHQGGLGDGIKGGIDLDLYNGGQKVVPNDYTLEFGNKTNIKIRAAKQWDVPVAANHYWDKYDTNSIIATISSDNKILTITSIKYNTHQHIFVNANMVGGVVRYKITGLTDDQTVVFRREKGNLTITTDGTYDVEWGTGNKQRNIYFGKPQTDCNIVIEILSAPAYDIIQNQVAWNVPHWRGFNVFWYGDIWINIDNMLSKYDTTKQKKIWYYTDDVSKFDSNIDNKEHQIEGLTNIRANWLQEVRINNKGDIVPSKIVNNATYKNSYYLDSKNDHVNTTFVGCAAGFDYKCGLFSFIASSNVNNYVSGSYGFVKVTILDD